ncbi:hypothetical protein WN55_05591 [Dufourea novaeangliae]|uniref:Uncharacterized protein n=1 Tax=Dufourea novaeangliae TaxID=178035 RepID=A0A154PN28_DUFNO|nr:hypothetical protein WN55_05591 [Dufourea novaeangliae]
MGVPDVEQAKRRLQDILRKAQKLEIPPQEVISTRTAQKLLARTRNVLAWTIWITVFLVLLSGVVYARWPTRQEVETIRTVLRRTFTKERGSPNVDVWIAVYEAGQQGGIQELDKAITVVVSGGRTSGTKATTSDTEGITYCILG